MSLTQFWGDHEDYHHESNVIVLYSPGPLQDTEGPDLKGSWCGEIIIAATYVKTGKLNKCRFLLMTGFGNLPFFMPLTGY